MAPRRVLTPIGSRVKISTRIPARQINTTAPQSSAALLATTTGQCSAAGKAVSSKADASPSPKPSSSAGSCAMSAAVPWLIQSVVQA